MYDSEKMFRIRKGPETMRDLDNTYLELIEFCSHHEKIYLFGTLNMSLRYLELLKKRNFIPDGFVRIGIKSEELHDIPEDLKIYICDPREIDFSNVSKIGIILSLNSMYHNVLAAQLPHDVELYHTTDNAIKLLYDREILCDLLAKIEKSHLLSLFSSVEEKWIDIQNTFNMLNDDELFKKNLLIYNAHGHDEINKIELKDVAIVMQGPIYKDQNFTLETLKLYRSIYPYIPIVLSTWKNDVEEVGKIFVEQCQDLNIIVLVNTVPEGPDWQNVNRQLTTTRNGLEFIVKYFKNVRYALKTRTDQRINMSDFLLYFKSLLKTYPINAPPPSMLNNQLESRLVFLSCENIWDPFYVCYYMAFGTINDMKKLYGPRIANIHERADFAGNVEKYIIRTFYKMYIGPIKDGDEINAYFNFLKSYAIIADTISLKVQWPKYLSSRHSLAGVSLTMNHAKWLSYCYCDNSGLKVNCVANGVNLDINL